MYPEDQFGKEKFHRNNRMPSGFCNICKGCHIQTPTYVPATKKTAYKCGGCGGLWDMNGFAQPNIR